MAITVYGKFERYVPTPAHAAWDIYKTVSAIFLMDGSGKDWYALQKELSNRPHFILYEQGGRILQYTDDPTKLWPEDCWIACLDEEDLPKGFLPKNGEQPECFEWKFFRGKICKYTMPKDLMIKTNEAERKKRLDIAFTHMKPLEYAVEFGEATDSERQQLTEWKRYCVSINRVDLGQDPSRVEWPIHP